LHTQNSVEIMFTVKGCILFILQLVFRFHCLAASAVAICGTDWDHAAIWHLSAP